MMRTRWKAVPVLTAVLALTGGSAAADSFTGEVNFLVGSKFVDGDDWAPLDDHLALGAQMSWGWEEWPVHIATDLFGSGDARDEVLIDDVGVTFELLVGVRKIWGEDRTHPYVGGGIGVVVAARYRDFGIFDDDDSDATVAPWVGIGSFWRLGSRFNIGVDVHYTRAEVELLGEDVEAGGISAGLLLGFGWPGQS